MNDLVVQGVEPLLFLDCFATGKFDVNVGAEFVDEVAKGCIEVGYTLVDGENSEITGMYSEGHYGTNGT